MSDSVPHLTRRVAALRADKANSLSTLETQIKQTGRSTKIKTQGLLPKETVNPFLQEKKFGFEAGFEMEIGQSNHQLYDSVQRLDKKNITDIFLEKTSQPIQLPTLEELVVSAEGGVAQAEPGLNKKQALLVQIA